ncbi:hypothetical protein SESBI_07260 [Sesbania bispinosa]|nr:hypothetical protein SESBI_07260 [Sesbania bispinosa]
MEQSRPSIAPRKSAQKPDVTPVTDADKSIQMVQSELSDLDASSPLQSQPLRCETRGRPLRGVSKVPAGPHASRLSDLGAPSQPLIHEARGRPLGRVFKAPAVPHSFNASSQAACQSFDQRAARSGPLPETQSVCPLYLHPRLLLSHWILPLFARRNPSH